MTSVSPQFTVTAKLIIKLALQSDARLGNPFCAANSLPLPALGVQYSTRNTEVGAQYYTLDNNDMVGIDMCVVDKFCG